jgi:hypothetical protein
MHFNVPTGDEFAFTVDGAASPEVIINYVDVRLQNYLRFDNHTTTTGTPPGSSVGYISVKIGSSVRKLYYY